MGAGMHGGFGATAGYKNAVAGEASLMGDKEQFLKNIRNRKDVDPGGKFDLIAHGTSSTVQIEHNGTSVHINSRTAAKIIKNMPGYNGQDIRLLSCSTGARADGFAQNLANKLNVNVYAPSDVLWATSDGRHFIAAKDSKGNPMLSKKGKFIKFKPGGGRK